MKKVLVTGSMGLVGSTAVEFYLEKGYSVIGIDNNMRKSLFGGSADCSSNLSDNPNYTHYGIDIRNTSAINLIVSKYKPEIIIHAAAQPSHDYSAKDPISDFDINARSTLILFDSIKDFSPESTVIYVSTNKVYGDIPNNIALRELNTRYAPIFPFKGFDETTDIDKCMHSLFGVSKLAGDLIAQEYARYFGIKTGIFRCGCITGSSHKGVELHGFLSYIARCAKEKRKYTIYGYKGKQVRDNIHAFDLVNAFDFFCSNPRPGEVYNMGGGTHSNISVLEALNAFSCEYEYVDKARKGDHIYYVSDVSKFRSHYPKWEYTYTIQDIIKEMYD